jgi:hypothetical protein
MRSTLSSTALSTVLASSLCLAQTLKTRPAAGQHPDEEAVTNVEPGPVRLPMTVTAGTPIKVALDSELRVRRVGQPIHAKTVEPVYAFDRLLIPAGTPVNR